MGRDEWSVCADWSCIMRRGRKAKRKTLKRKKKVANRILLGLHFVFVCRKKRKKKRERKKKKMQLL